eukprot:SAG25_NODE_10894_length_320_cov_0.832579_1_plen_54_part_01
MHWSPAAQQLEQEGTEAEPPLSPSSHTSLVGSIDTADDAVAAPPLAELAEARVL